MTNLATTLTQAAARYPDRAAVLLDQQLMRYRDLAGASARAASWLRGRGIRPGDRVALMLPNVPEFPVLYYGILRAGGIVVPTNPLLKAREVANYLADSQAALALAGHGAAGEAAGGARRAGADWRSSSRRGWPAGSPPAPRTERSPPAGRPTPPLSSTPPGPPASPRGPSSPTTTCCATSRSPARR